MVRLGLCVLRRKITEVKCVFFTLYERYILSTWFITVNLNPLAEVVIFQVLHFILFPTFLLCFSEGSLYTQPTLKASGVMLHIFESEVSISIIWNSSAEELVYSVIYLYVCLLSAWLMDIYFIICVIIQYCFPYFVAPIVSGFVIAVLSVGSCIPLIYPHCVFILLFCLFVSLFFSTSLLSGTTKCPRSSCIFAVPDLETAISLRTPGFFHWRMVLENKIWVEVCLLWLECPCF